MTVSAAVKTELPTPKLFISYAWTSEDFRVRVRNLADRLMSDGVNVLIDQYELSGGSDLQVYMEKSVNDPSVTKVIAIINPTYVQKSNNRAGGVGTETTIMSKKVYEQIHSDVNKFTAVLFERGEPESLPTMFTNKVYIDMSTPDLEIEKYDELLRWAFDRPVLRKPMLGAPPAYLLEDEPKQSTTALQSKQLNLAIKSNNVRQIERYFKQYLEAMTQTLKAFEPAIKTENNRSILDPDLAVAAVKGFSVYRLEYAELLKEVITGTDLADQKLEDCLGEFFDELGDFAENLTWWNKAENLIWNRECFDHAGICVHALFIDTFALLRKANYQKVAQGLLEREFITQKPNSSSKVVSRYPIFYAPSEVFRNLDGNMRIFRPEITAARLMRETIPKTIKLEDFYEADFVLALYSELHSIRDGHRSIYWYAVSMATWNNQPMPSFLAGTQLKRIQPTLELLGFDNISQLKSAIEIARPMVTKEDSRFTVLSKPTFDSLININQLGIRP
jgi:hypothetical protein